MGTRSPTWTTADMKELSVTLPPRNKFSGTHSQLSQLVGGGARWLLQPLLLREKLSTKLPLAGFEPPIFRLGAQSEYHSATHTHTHTHTHAEEYKLEKIPTPHSHLRKIGHDQRELGVHGRIPYEVSLFHRIPMNEFPLSVGN